MSRSALRLSAAVITTLIIVLGITAFDRLPGSVRSRIDVERTALASAQTALHKAQDAVSRETQSDAALFQALAASHQWPAQFQQAGDQLASAGRDMDELTRLEQHGHHSDQSRAESLLNEERRLRTGVADQASAIQSTAASWMDRKNHLSQDLSRMEQNYQSIHGFDLEAVKTAVTRAETDWPDKKTDLAARLQSLTEVTAESDQAWQSTADARREAAAGNIPEADAGRLLAASDTLKMDVAALPQRAAALQSLTGQLYDTWDKVLVDMEERGFGSSRVYDQKIRTIRTHTGDGTTSQDQWVEVAPATYSAMRNDLGMAIEHKPAGKYDSEANQVAQPAGFAYMAPPSQGSNQYGYWDHRDGQSFWVFYGQYALMRDLLFNHTYRPLPRDEWEDYRSARDRGNTYYGRDAESASGAPKYGTNGTTTQERYSGSTYARQGGFRNSPYASHSGSYSQSPFASRSLHEPEPESGGHSFGQRSRPEVGHSYRPAPRSMPRFGGGGRHFGRH